MELEKLLKRISAATQGRAIGVKILYYPGQGFLAMLVDSSGQNIPATCTYEYALNLDDAISGLTLLAIAYGDSLN